MAFTSSQIIGFLREADAGTPIKGLCRRHGFSEASYYLWRGKLGGWTSRTPNAKGPRSREREAQETPGRGHAQPDSRRKCYSGRGTSRPPSLLRSLIVVLLSPDLDDSSNREEEVRVFVNVITQIQIVRPLLSRYPQSAFFKAGCHGEPSSP